MSNETVIKPDARRTVQTVRNELEQMLVREHQDRTEQMTRNLWDKVRRMLMDGTDWQVMRDALLTLSARCPEQWPSGQRAATAQVLEWLEPR